MDALSSRIEFCPKSVVKRINNSIHTKFAERRMFVYVCFNVKGRLPFARLENVKKTMFEWKEKIIQYHKRKGIRIRPRGELDGGGRVGVTYIFFRRVVPGVLVGNPFGTI
jgi:hypothetical protein